MFDNIPNKLIKNKNLYCQSIFRLIMSLFVILCIIYNLIMTFIIRFSNINIIVATLILLVQYILNILDFLTVIFIGNIYYYIATGKWSKCIRYLSYNRIIMIRIIISIIAYVTIRPMAFIYIIYIIIIYDADLINLILAIFILLLFLDLIVYIFVVYYLAIYQNINHNLLLLHKKKKKKSIRKK
jgi:hypothetical protein